MKDPLLILSYTLVCAVVFLVPEPIKSATQIIQCCHHVLLGQVLSGLGNLHTCSLLAPLLSPRITTLHFPDSLDLDLPQTELIELFQRLPTCSSLQKLHFGAKVNIADKNPPPLLQDQLKDERKGQTYHCHLCFLLLPLTDSHHHHHHDRITTISTITTTIIIIASPPGDGACPRPPFPAPALSTSEISSKTCPC